MRKVFPDTILDHEAELVGSLWLNVRGKILLRRKQPCGCGGSDADEAE